MAKFKKTGRIKKAKETTKNIADTLGEGVTVGSVAVGVGWFMSWPLAAIGTGVYLWGRRNGKKKG